MAARPYWNGQLRLALVSCGISLTSATTSVEKIKLNRIEAGKGTRLRQQMVNEESGKVVDRDKISLGYEFEKGRYVEVSSEELEALKIESSDVIVIERVVPETAVDPLYFDKPYFVTPNDKNSIDVFAVIRDVLRAKKVVGIGRMAVARRESAVLIRPVGKGMMLETLLDVQEVRDAGAFFDNIADVKTDKTNLELAATLIERMEGAFDLSLFEDRYQTALRELVEAKVKGQQPSARKSSPVSGTRAGDLFAALRASIADNKTGNVTRLPMKAKANAKAPAAKGKKRA